MLQLLQGFALSTDYWSYLYPISASTDPVEPRTVAELGALFSRNEVRDGALTLVARNDATLSALAAISTVTGATDLDFLQRHFAVLDLAAITAAAASIQGLLATLQADPQLALRPFVMRYVDGTDHQPYEVGQVIEAIESSVASSPPHCISSEDCWFLWDVFCYVKSVLSLLEAASASGNAVVFARLTELYEKALNADVAAQAQGTVS
jgi:hypothetical protein